MDKKRNIELENWLIETTGEEMMANHLGPNWNRFHEEYGFYPNISMTIADQVWEHKQKRIDELNKCHLSRVAELTRLNKVKVNKIIELQTQLDEVNASNLRRSVHIDRLQKHNLKLQQRLKENGLEWKDLIEEQALKGGQV